MEEIEAIPFCSASSEAATVSCKLARRTPPVRPVPCLPIGLDPGSELSGLEALQPGHVETSSHIHCGFDTICLEQLREEVFSKGNICGCDVMGGKFCALKFKRPSTPLKYWTHPFCWPEASRCKVPTQLL